MPQHGFTVRAKWDGDDRIWYVEETDVPGLFVEADTFEEFVETVRKLVPELLRLNRALPPDGTRSVPVDLVRSETVELAG